MNLIEEIKNKITIESLCDYEGLRKYPFNRGFKIHSLLNANDNNPSCMVYVKDNSFNDFSVNVGGDVIRFFEILYSCDTKQAVHKLAGMIGYDLNGNLPRRGSTSHHNQCHPELGSGSSDQTLKQVQGDNNRRRDDNFQSSLSKKELEFYQERLSLSDEATAKRDTQVMRLDMNKKIFAELHAYCSRKGYGGECLNYMVNKRGIQPDVLERFKIFFIGNYNEVNGHLKKTFDVDDLVRAGLFNSKEGKSNLIFFYHRIMIPYLSGDDIVYLRARYFDTNGSSDNNGGPKFIGLISDSTNVNTPKRWYNSNAFRRMLPGERVFITEGEIDAVSIESMGYNAIAIPGTGNIPPVKKFLPLVDKKVVVAVDNDGPGRKLLTGNYVDKNGADKYSDHNLTRIFESLGVPFYTKQFGEGIKDANQFLMAG